MPLSTRRMCCSCLNHLGVWKWEEEKKNHCWSAKLNNEQIVLSTLQMSCFFYISAYHFLITQCFKHNILLWLMLMFVWLEHTGTLLPRQAWCRCSCWWSRGTGWRRAAVEAVCVCNRTLLGSSRGAAWLQEGPLWRQPAHMGCCSPCSVAK